MAQRDPDPGDTGYAGQQHEIPLLDAKHFAAHQPGVARPVGQDHHDDDVPQPRPKRRHQRQRHENEGQGQKCIRQPGQQRPNDATEIASDEANEGAQNAAENNGCARHHQ